MTNMNGAHPDPFAARDRLMRARSAALTPGKRLESMWRLQASCFALLASNPAAFDRFWRRNLRRRRVTRAARLEHDDRTLRAACSNCPGRPVTT